MAVPRVLRAILWLAGLGLLAYATVTMYEVSFGLATAGAFVGLWFLCLWGYVAAGYRSPVTLPSVTETDTLSAAVERVRLGVVIQVTDEPVHQVVEAVAAAKQVTENVVLVGVVPAHALLARRYACTYVDSSVLAEQLINALGDVDAVFPVTASGVVNATGLQQVVNVFADPASQVLSVSGVSAENRGNPSNGVSNEWGVVTFLRGLRQRGVPVWIPNSTVFARSLFTTEALERVQASYGATEWGRVFASHRRSRTVCVDSAVVVFRQGQAYTTGSYWFHQTQQQGLVVSQGSDLAGHVRSFIAGVGVLLATLKGYATVLLLLIPVGVAMSYVPSAGYGWWLLMVVGFPLTAWLILLLRDKGMRGAWSVAAAAVSCAAVSINVTRFMGDNPKVLKGSPERMNLRTLAFVGAVSVSAGVFQVWLAQGNPTTVEHYVWMGVSMLVGLWVLVGVAWRVRAARHARATERVACGIPARVTVGADSWNMTVVDYSVGGAALVGDVPPLLSGVSGLVCVDGFVGDVPFTVVRWSECRLAVRVDDDPAVHMRWAAWVTSGATESFVPA